MAKLPQFDPPANQNDFCGEEEKEKALRTRWSNNINRYTEQTLKNDPWSSVNQPPLSQYFNPLKTDIPEGTKGVPIKWTAFPNRILMAYPNVGERTQWQYADEGPPPEDNYGPSGPRGWQDEYCEWSVTRNAQGKITKIMFTCENREYWYTLWEVDPNVVLGLYQKLVSPEVKIEDLYLRNQQGNLVIDPATGRPAYNDRNAWNSTTTAGAVHLISNPNSLSAEVFLAGQATVLRRDVAGNPITDKNQLINCSRYGTPNRNSDPTIGASVNGLVRGTGAPGSGLRISLANPVGLYIQEPSFNTYELPFDAPEYAKPSDYWKVIRGRKRDSGEEMDYILHAVYEVPEELGFTVSDITINGFNIEYGAQIAQTFQIALAGLGLPQVNQDGLLCAGEPKLLPRPYVLRELEMLSVAFRSSLNMRIEPGTTVENVVLYAFDSDSQSTIEFTGSPGITFEQTDFQDLGSNQQVFILTITAAPDAPLGNRSILMKNPDPDNPANYYGGPAVFGLLEVVAPGTLNRNQDAAVSEVAETAPTAIAVPDKLLLAPMELSNRSNTR
ncbi:hypothetical protein [Moorena producens]|uniref:hypothetical protein n=1 Tax=Moorena producens TaxID=1155739 RepID=UPI003C76EB3B